MKEGGESVGSSSCWGEERRGWEEDEELASEGIVRRGRGEVQV